MQPTTLFFVFIEMWWVWSSLLILSWLWFLWAKIVAPFWEDYQLGRARQRLLERIRSSSSSSLRLPPGALVVVLANPISGGGRAAKTARDLVVPVLEQARRVTVRLILTAPQLSNVSADMLQGAAVVVVVGGDGTIHQLINRVGIAALASLALCVVPCGSSNGFAASFCSGVESATANVLFGKSLECDLLELSFMDPSLGGATRTVHEIQVVALGIIAEHDELQEHTLRPYFGPFIRGIVAPFIVMIRARVYNVTLTWTPGEANHSCSVNSILLGGTAWGDSTGRFAPNARIDDGLWNAVLFLKDSSLGLIYTFLKIHSNGQHVTRPQVRHFPFETLTIQPKEHPGPHLISIAGERYNFLDKIECRVLPRVLKVLCEGTVKS